MNPLVAFAAIGVALFFALRGHGSALLQTGRFYRFTGEVEPPVDLPQLKTLFPFFEKFTSVAVEQLPGKTRITWDDKATRDQEMQLPHVIFQSGNVKVAIVAAQALPPQLP